MCVVMCVSMCSSVILSVHSEGRGQGGWFNRTGQSRFSSAQAVRPNLPHLRLFPAKQLNNVFSPCWTRSTGHLHRLKPSLRAAVEPLQVLNENEAADRAGLEPRSELCGVSKITNLRGRRQQQPLSGGMGLILRLLFSITALRRRSLCSTPLDSTAAWWSAVIVTVIHERIWSTVLLKVFRY